MTATAPSGARYGVTSMVAPLQRVLVRRPATSGDWDGAGWRTPDPATLERQHAAFVELLDGLGVRGRGRRRARRPGRRGLHARPADHERARRRSRSTWPSRRACASPGTPREGSRASTSPCSARSEATPTPTAATASGSTTRPRRSGSATARTSAGAHALAGAARARGRPRRDLRHAARPGPGATCCTCSRSCPRSTEVAVRRLRAARPRPPAAGHPGARDRVDRDRPARAIDAMGCNMLAVRPGVVVMVDGAPEGPPGARGQGRRGARLRRLRPLASRATAAPPA